jgi:hypothetical protein
MKTIAGAPTSSIAAAGSSGINNTTPTICIASPNLPVAAVSDRIVALTTRTAGQMQ